MNINELTIDPDMTIREALKKINTAGKKCLLVCSKGTFIGTLSDGDIRKALLSNADMENSIEKYFNKNSYAVYEKDFNESEIKEIFLEKKFDIIPILNKSDQPIKILEWDTVFAAKKKAFKLNIPVVIMAGGKGTRMKPFTNVLPKPLIPLNNQTVIEKIIETFLKAGIESFYMTINFKGKILKAFFEELDPDYSMEFIEESKPLGTGGSLNKFIGKIKSTFMVVNCDTIIDVDHADLIEFHNKHNCDITLVASTKEIIIPYGSCEIDKNGFLKNILEKPTLDYLINTGLYVLEPEVLKYIPVDEFFHITDLIDLLKKKGKKIGVFPIDEAAWVDVGQWAEYREAVKRLN